MHAENPLPHVSLVIPAYNEARYLPRLLDSVDAAARSYSRGPEAVEVVVVDNASTDRTAAIVRDRGHRVVPCATRAIAAARNAGIAQARGEIVGVVDADMRIHPGTFDAIERALASDRVVGGATGATLDRWSLGLAVTYAMLVPFVWLTGFDTGVVFFRRRDFEATGGYDERLRVAEDVKFLLALRRVGKRQGKRLVRLRGVKAVASTRKFDEHGDWHYLTTMPRMAVGLLLKRASSLRQMESYWYEPRR